ncbi:HTTM domain-containing protein [Halorubrum sp. GN11_10-6_MGM]|uniref:HTTM domain-containing protein n=1 Tax=Halorubrum sp. GN11_10-6_MGM TaxID=2518112 RepID=UPI0010F5AC06|nr:HTTM domain-containing protein [Halorubrum sp. GN11_10-6_MGM]TKX75160.1 HTTM domain-containing protein [Halorubrum sp. GN11_10-6_MGM]
MTPPRQRLSNAGSRYAAARESLRDRARPHLGIDPRALGAFRIAVALVVLADLLVYRLPAVRTFYTDGGVLPRSTLAEAFPLLERASLFAISGSARVQTGLLAVAAIAAVCLLVGYRTRAATGLSFVLLASLYARNPYVLNGGNTILVAFLFLSLFIPLDARWSLGSDRRGDRDGGDGRGGGGGGVRNGADGGDSRDSADGRDGADERASGDRGEPADPRVCSIATAVTLLTFVSIYAANAVSKYRSDAWMSGGAVSRIFQLGEFTVGLGPLVSEYAAALTAVNWLWIALLSVSPLLVVATGRSRTTLVAAFVSAHLGMAATMRLAVFPFVMGAILLLFLPPGAWDRVEAVAPKRPESLRLADRSRPRRNDGGADAGTASSTPSRGRRVIGVGAAALLVGVFVALVWWQAAGVGLVDLPASESVGELSEVSWSFFAPNPPDASGWYVAAGTLESGDAIDLRDGEEPTYDRPPDAAETYPTTLWHQFGFRMKNAGESRYRPVASYLCERSDRELQSVTVFHVEQAVDASGAVGEPERERQIRVAC